MHTHHVSGGDSGTDWPIVGDVYVKAGGRSDLQSARYDGGCAITYTVYIRLHSVGRFLAYASSASAEEPNAGSMVPVQSMFEYRMIKLDKVVIVISKRTPLRGCSSAIVPSPNCPYPSFGLSERSTLIATRFWGYVCFHSVSASLPSGCVMTWEGPGSITYYPQ